jgi:GNAT superfamily N-acetyltransferase
MPDEITVRAEAADSLIAVRLVDAMVTEMDQLYGQAPGGGVGSGASPSDFTPPTGAFLVIYAAGKPVAGGGLKRDDDGVAEIKRMYVVPEARGRGVAKVVLAALEDEARGRGWTTLRLETGPRQPEAIALYTRAGYRPTEAFGAYVADANAGDSLFFEQALPAP